MHQVEGHHSASRFAPHFLVKQWIHAGESVERAGLPRQTGAFPVPEKAHFPSGKVGAKATQNGDHNSVHVFHRPLSGPFRGAVFHQDGVPGNSPLTLMGRFPSLMGRFLTLMGRFPECLNGPFSLSKIAWKTAH